jgi:hypothetical protein
MTRWRPIATLYCNTLILLKIGFIKNLLETFNSLRNIRLLYFSFRHFKTFSKIKLMNYRN